jgi:hypothetical protein
MTDLVTIEVDREHAHELQRLENEWLDTLPHGLQHLTVAGPSASNRREWSISLAFREYVLDRKFPFTDKPR